MPQIKKLLLCHSLCPKKCTRTLLFYYAQLKQKRDLLFTKRLQSINTLGNNADLVTEKDEIYLNKTNIVSFSRTIIDEIILFYRNLDSILIYLECVYKVFLKHRVRFRLNKCDFLKTRFEYVIHDVAKAVN